MMPEVKDTREWVVGCSKRKAQKPISNEIVVDIAYALLEKALCSNYSSTNTRVVSSDLSLLWSTVRKVLISIVKWYPPYKIHVVQVLKPSYLDI